MLQLPGLPTEAERIASALAAAHFRVRTAARTLNMSPERLIEKMRESDVAHAVAEAREALEERTSCDLDWIVMRLMRIADLDMREIAEWGPTMKHMEQVDGTIQTFPGVYLKESSTLAEATAYGIIEIGNTKEGVKIKTADKRAALMDLAKIFGHVTEKTESKTTVQNVPLDLAKLNDEQLEKYEALMKSMLTPDNK